MTELVEQDIDRHLIQRYNRPKPHEHNAFLPIAIAIAIAIAEEKLNSVSGMS